MTVLSTLLPAPVLFSKFLSTTSTGAKTTKPAGMFAATGFDFLSKFVTRQYHPAKVR
jgi:hypothetical protein